jgi:ZPR1 zinc finger protein
MRFRSFSWQKLAVIISSIFSLGRRSRLASAFLSSSAAYSRSAPFIFRPSHLSSPSSRYYTKTFAVKMPRGVKKEHLPSKICVTCGRPFTWRKKWERCWDEVTTCSKSCNSKRRQKGKPTNTADEGDAAGQENQSRQGQRRSFSSQASDSTLDDDDDDDDKMLLQSLAAAGRTIVNLNKDVSDSTENDGSSDASESSMHNKTLDMEQIPTFRTPCPQCFAPTETRICPTNIPHFDNMLLYSTTCDDCGYKSSELKQGVGNVPPKGRKWTLQVKSLEDLSRDVIKSGSTGIEIPELELQLEPSCSGGGEGAYTTVEGLLRTMHSTLQQANPFSKDVSTDPEHSEPSQQQKFKHFLQSLRDIADGKRLPFTLIMMDPLAASFIGPRSTSAATAGNDTPNDENLTVEDFERTEEQNEMLGISRSSMDTNQDAAPASDLENIRQAERQARKEAKRAKKAERRAQRQGKGDPDAGKKSCDLCSKHVNLLIRCLHEEGQVDWSMVCGKCWHQVSGGVPDGDANHPHYRYGGLWKNRRAQQG